MPVPAGPIPNVTVQLADRVDVALLVDGLRRDPLAAVAPDDVLEDVAEVLGLVERGEHGVDRVRADVVAALDELHELVDDRARLGDLRLVALDRQLVAAEADRAAQPVAQRLEHAVADPGELGRDLVRDGENLLHAPKCRARQAAAAAPDGLAGHDARCRRLREELRRRRRGARLDRGRAGLRRAFGTPYATRSSPAR